MYALLWLFDTIVTLLVYVLIASAVLSWLIAFNVVNSSSQVVRTIGEFLFRVTEPLLAPIRRVLPDLGGIDISPIVLILGLYFIRMLVFELLLP